MSTFNQYMKEMHVSLPEDYSNMTEGEGLPKEEIDSKSIEIPGLVILSIFSQTGYEYRSKQRQEEYEERTRRNMEYSLSGQFDKIETFDWVDPAVTLMELESKLIQYKNAILETTPSCIGTYIQVFIELDYPKSKVIPFLGILRKLNIQYKETS